MIYRYKSGKREKSKKRRLIFWLFVVLLLAGLGFWGWTWLRAQLKPHVTIKQAAAVNTQVNFNDATKTYNEGDFSIALPTTWTLLPRPPGPYHSFTWESSDRGTNGQQIEILEDIIPAQFAVNRALIVTGEVDHLQLDGPASDNCANFTGAASIGDQTGAPAKWQGVPFLCDVHNVERDVIGTSSTDGVNTVILQSQSTGVKHKFLFFYTDESVNPDYTVFYNALNSLRMN